jgi:hypothetical protein
MWVKRAVGRAFFMSAAIGVASAAMAAGPIPSLPALGLLQPGLWQLSIDGEPERKLCLGDPYVLIQLGHSAAPCNRLVIASEKMNATVHYSCPGSGWGRTTVRVETPRLARVETQGIAGKAPFAFTAEARRVGACDSVSTTSIR